MPVTFGTVQLVPQTAAPPAKEGHETASGDKPHPPDPRDLAPALRHLHDRGLRLRAH